MTHNHSKYLDLRRSYPFFEFQRYSFQINNQILKIEYEFNISDQFLFKPTLMITPGICRDWHKIDSDLLNNIVFHIGMIEMISYWKCTCSPRVIIRPFKLDEQQADWWKKLYLNGLGEFFYLNNIDIQNDFMTIESGSKSLKAADSQLDEKKIIVPIGGGKDSVVTLELLKKSGFDVVPMAINPRAAILRSIQSAGYDNNDSFIVKRKIDPLLLELNSKGFLNGHTPFSAMLAFVTAIVAIGSGHKYVALSNEDSASESTIPGTNINHQYSKSVEFEEDFRHYVKTYIHKELEYFSFLRPLNELQIAALFSKFPWHFDGFRSCNVGSKDDSWCGKCPKCLFTFIMLAPFLGKQKLLEIFGRDLLDDAELEKIYDELTGIAAIKPFECVGTPEEINAAIEKLVSRSKSSELPFLIKKHISKTGQFTESDDFEQVLSRFNSNHFVPDQFAAPLEKSARSICKNGFDVFISSKLKDYKRILILGFGKEGQSSFEFLKPILPDITFGIADLNPDSTKKLSKEIVEEIKIHTGENYLKAIQEYDLVIKSPGVKLDVTTSEIQLSSQTELFLEYFKTQTIGITGTKGKSTTSSLIYHILKTNNKKTVILGNIGVPSFDMINDIDAHTIVVYELSAHQLQSLQVSPHIAVLLNIFPEHLDYFEDFDIYKNAKKEIYKHQLSNDVLVTDYQLSSSLGPVPSTLKTFANIGDRKLKDSLKNLKIPLKGIHNMINIEAATIAVGEFGINFKEVLKSLESFQPLPHRLEYVGRFGGVEFINDSISTVPESAIAALMTHPDTTILILGGLDRSLDYTQLVEFTIKSNVQLVFLLGKAGKTMKDLFALHQSKEQKIVMAANLNEVFRTLSTFKISSGKCLLSPAAASYDEYLNFEHRGDSFKQLAKAYE